MERLRFFAQRVLASDSSGDAEQHWRAFLAGGWQIVDHFDAEGRRYVIARRGAAAPALGPAELQLLARRARGERLERIAVDLGLSVSAVSRRLKRALRKLGLRSHAELPRLFPSPHGACLSQPRSARSAGADAVGSAGADAALGRV